MVVWLLLAAGCRLPVAGRYVNDTWERNKAPNIANADQQERSDAYVNSTWARNQPPKQKMDGTDGKKAASQAAVVDGYLDVQVEDDTDDDDE